MSHRNLLKPGKLIGILCVGWALSAGASTASADTDVSLTFGSAIDNQYQARAMLADHDMLGTFYVNSGRIGNAGRLTWKQVTELAQDGNEIGGQTVDNFNLVGMTPADLQHQVCDDRTELLQRGYAPTSFNYPTTASQTDAAAQAMVEQCGYSSGSGRHRPHQSPRQRVDSAGQSVAGPHPRHRRQRRHAGRDPGLDPGGGDRGRGRSQLVPARLQQHLRRPRPRDLPHLAHHHR